jgi:GT2 family glycosyltransferase
VKADIAERALQRARRTLSASWARWPAPLGTYPRLYCDRLELWADRIAVMGWAVSDAGIVGVSAEVDGVVTGSGTYGSLRSDVQQAFPDIAGSADSGFELHAAFSRFLPTGRPVHVRVTAHDRAGRTAAHEVTLEPQPATLPSLSRSLALLRPARGSQAGDLPDPVDIVVPVFNGLEHLRPLFDSLRRNTERAHRLIVVDDASTDPRVVVLLDDLARTWPNVLLLRNEENLGFVRSVNRAVERTRGHFVLLNTDVVVPPGWLERLMRPILAHDDVGSVTPFSNSATICSFPVPLIDNPLHLDLEPEALDRAFRYVDQEVAAAELPTGVGFCMAFNRRAVDAVGMFHEVFAEGYGEENDWCRRAARAGFRHLVAPNLFVFHRHGGSFTPEKRASLLTRNLQVLTRRHPNYLRLVDAFIAADPLREARDVVRAVAGFEAAGPAGGVLVLDHDRGGGANFYSDRRIAGEAAAGRPVLAVRVPRGGSGLTVSCHDRDGVVRFSAASPVELDPLVDLLRPRELFVNQLYSFPDVPAIIQQVLGWKDRLGASLTVAAHDFFPICPSYTLLDHRETFCGIPDASVCAACLPNHHIGYFLGLYDRAEIGPWRATWWSLLRHADRVVFFSESTRALYRRAYPDLEEARTAVEPHPVEYLPPVTPLAHTDGPFVIGVIGRISVEKGSRFVERLVDVVRERHLNVRIVVVGEIHSERLRQGHGGVVMTGPYERTRLPHLIQKHGIHCVLVPSIWPETFCFVAEEAMTMGLPLAVFDLGAPAERVKGYERGLILPTMDAGVALDAILARFSTQT